MFVTWIRGAVANSTKKKNIHITVTQFYFISTNTFEWCRILQKLFNFKVKKNSGL